MAIPVLAQSFKFRLLLNLKRASKLAVLLAAVSIVRGIIQGRGLAASVLDTVILYALVVPPAVVVYTTLSPFRSRGRLAHYVVWLITAFCAWLPVFLLTRFASLLNDETGVFTRWPTFLVAIMMASVIWATIAESLDSRALRHGGPYDDRGSA